MSISLLTNDGAPRKFLRGVREIADYCERTERQMRHIIRTGKFPHFRMGTAMIWARISDVDQWIDNQVKKNLEGAR